MNKFVVFVIIFLFLGMFFSIDIFAKSNIIFEENINNELTLLYYDDQLDQNNTMGPISVGVVQGPPINYRFAQSFKPTLNILTRVELFLSLGVSIYDGDITLSIRSDIYGNDLVSSSIKANSINEIGWYLFDLKDLNVIPEKTYFIVLQSFDYETGCSWWFGSDTYDRGYSGSQIYNQMWVFNYVDFLFKTYGLNDMPPNNPVINGPTLGGVGDQFTYSFVSEDPEGDDVFYQINWGDGNIDVWDGPYESNELMSRLHRWNFSGTFSIQARAKDTNDNIGDWGTLNVVIPRNRVIKIELFIFLLERLPMLQQLLNRLGYLNI